jgi:hypothetical protein
MTRRLLVALCLLLSVGAARAAQGEDQGHIIIVLDCSRHMQSAFAADADAEHAVTRWDLARGAVTGLLEELASDEQHAVTLVLFGHRIASVENQTPGNDDGRVVQVDYLRLNGDKLERVPPGLDVEVLRESRRLTADNLAAYGERLSAIRPGGAAPLWLAIGRAAEAADADNNNAAARIVVLTNGLNEQPGASQPTTPSVVKRLLTARRARLQVVQFGPPAETDANLAAVAEATGGAVALPESAEQIADAVLAAAGLKEQQQLPAPFPVRLASQVGRADMTPEQLKDLQQSTFVSDITIELTYYGAPVKDATIYLRGDNFDLEYSREAEYGNKELRISRVAGKYVFPKVPHGPYVAEIAATVHNRKYVVVRELSVDKDNLAFPELSLKIQLEKSKDPPPVAASPAPAP